MKRRIAVALVAVIAFAGCGSKPQSAAQKKCVYEMSGQRLLATATDASVLDTAKSLVKWWAGYDKQERQRLVAACLRNPDPND